MELKTRHIIMFGAVIFASVISGMFAGSWLISRQQSELNLQAIAKLDSAPAPLAEKESTSVEKTNSPLTPTTSVDASSPKSMDINPEPPLESSPGSDSQALMTQAVSAYAAKDYKGVLDTLIPLAEAGDSLAQYRIGLMYANGLGVAPDIDLAIPWLEKAVANEMADARELLLAQYNQKVSDASSVNEEIPWYEQAADLQDINAQAILGSYYLSGTGVQVDYAKALDLLTKAASSDARAMSNLGYMYSTGTGVDKDDSTAHTWYKKAAKLGFVRAQTAVALQYESGRGVEKNLADAVRWYLSAASTGEKHATTRIGSLIANGTIQSPSVDEAVPAVNLAAAAGDATAIAWIKSRSEEGHGAAQSVLADMLFEGTIIEPDESQALVLLKSAADGNHSASQFALAERFTTGNLLELDYVLAHKWANLASISAYPGAAELRDTLNQLMTPDQVTEAQQRARDWLASNPDVLVGDSLATSVISSIESNAGLSQSESLEKTELGIAK